MSNKPETRHARRMRELREQLGGSEDEGKWKITFVFDGKLYTRTHRLSAGEIKHMKDLCVQFGDEASGQIVWRAAIKGVGVVSENVMADAGKDFVAKHYKGPQGPASDGKKSVTYEDLARSELVAVTEAYVESRKPLPEAEAFSEEAKEKIVEETLKDQL